MNCTFFWNLALMDGGAINSLNKSHRITNCILYYNVPNQIRHLSGLPAVSYCDIQGGWRWFGSHNIDFDPMFCDAEHGDFHLKWGSPCIDMGTNSGINPYDFEWEPRPNPDTRQSDIGADEYYPNWTPPTTPTVMPTQTPVPLEPVILLAGFWDTEFHSPAGIIKRLEVKALITDTRDIDIQLAGLFPLYDDGQHGDFGAGDGWYGLQWQTSVQLTQGSLVLPLTPYFQGVPMQTWPYLTVE